MPSGKMQRYAPIDTICFFPLVICTAVIYSAIE